MKQSAFEHNTTLMPLWYQELTKQNARAAIMLAYTEDGTGVVFNANSLTKQDVIDLLRTTLEQLDNGKQTITT